MGILIMGGFIVLLVSFLVLAADTEWGKKNLYI